MITENQRAERLRDHRELKEFLELALKAAKTKGEKEHLNARIAEVENDIEATKLPTKLLEPVAVQKPKALLPKITKTAEENAKKAETHIVQPIRQKFAEPKRKLMKMKKVGNSL
jgi:hypothetical protein